MTRETKRAAKMATGNGNDAINRRHEGDGMVGHDGRTAAHPIVVDGPLPSVA